MIEEEDLRNIDPLLKITRRPSDLLKALSPIQVKGKDEFIRVKEQWLLEKFVMHKQIEQDNEKQKIIN